MDDSRSMSWLNDGEGDGVAVVDVLELHGGKVLGQAAEAYQPRCAEDDIDVIADVEELGIDVEDVGVNAKWYTKGCCAAGDLVATIDKYGGVDALFQKADEVGDIDVDDVVRGARVNEDVDACARHDPHQVHGRPSLD